MVVILLFTQMVPSILLKQLQNSLCWRCLTASCHFHQLVHRLRVATAAVSRGAFGLRLVAKDLEQATRIGLQGRTRHRVVTQLGRDSRCSHRVAAIVVRPGETERERVLKRL